MSDPAIREAVLNSLPEGEFVRAETIEQLRHECGLVRFTNKQVRRALESARYGHYQITLIRPRINDMVRGWSVLKMPSAR